jgi:hypothetical protein
MRVSASAVIIAFLGRLRTVDRGTGGTERSSK